MSTVDLDQLSDWLDSEDRSEDCIDVQGLHGYLTALFLCGEALSDTWIGTAIDQPLAKLQEKEAEFIAQSCTALYNFIGEELYADEDMSLTFEPTVDRIDSEMEAWCQGFMEIVFELPDKWVHAEEEELSLLLLPIECASGLFEEEADFQKLYQQPELLKQMFEQIPELLTDIYLLFNAPSK